MTKTIPDFRSTVREALGDRSLNWLAKEADVPYGRLHEWLNSHKTIHSDHLQHIAKALGLALRKS